MRGETRATLALIFGIVFAGVLSFLAVTGNGDALIAIIATISSMTGFYFGAKTGSEKPQG